MNKLVAPLIGIGFATLIVGGLVATGVLQPNTTPSIGKNIQANIAGPNGEMTSNGQQTSTTGTAATNGQSNPLFDIIDTYMRAGDYTHAQDTLTQLLDTDPANADTLIKLVRVKIALQQPDQARDLLAKITVPSIEKFYYQGLLAAYFHDYETAKTSLQAIVTQSPNAPLAQKAQQVLASFSTFATNDGGQELFLRTLLAKSFNQVEEYRLAIPLLFDVVKEKRDYRDAWILLGFAYINVNDPHNAIDALNEGLKLDPNKPETLFFLGLAYSANNGQDHAIKLITEAISKGFEPRIQAHQKLAEMHLGLQHWVDAAREYRAVTELNSGDINYFIRPVWLYIDKLNMPDQALELAQTALKTHPDSAMAFNLLGWAYLASGKADDAKTNLTKALERDPNLSAAYLNFGKLYEKLGSTESALEYYKIAVKLGAGTSVGDTAQARITALAPLAPNPPQPQLQTSPQSQTPSQQQPQPTYQQNQIFIPRVGTSSALPRFTLPPIAPPPTIQQTLVPLDLQRR